MRHGESGAERFLGSDSPEDCPSSQPSRSPFADYLRRLRLEGGRACHFGSTPEVGVSLLPHLSKEEGSDAGSLWDFSCLIASEQSAASQPSRAAIEPNSAKSDSLSIMVFPEEPFGSMPMITLELSHTLSPAELVKALLGQVPGGDSVYAVQIQDITVPREFEEIELLYECR